MVVVVPGGVVRHEEAEAEDRGSNAREGGRSKAVFDDAEEEKEKEKSDEPARRTSTAVEKAVDAFSPNDRSREVSGEDKNGTCRALAYNGAYKCEKGDTCLKQH